MARILMGATAMLYMGPLLAGLGGYGWNMVPAFAGIFTLWQIILRPEKWPAPQDLDRADAWLAVAAQVALQTLLVVICFGIGRGIGGAAGSLPLYSPLVPVGLSFLSIAICQILSRPARPVRSADQDHIDAAIAKADRLLQPLEDAAGTMSEAEVARHLNAMAQHVDPARLRDALLARVTKGAGPNVQLALAVQLSDAVLAKAQKDKAQAA
jgi:hypothetical protein